MKTQRREIIDLLSQKEMGAREISQAVGIREKVVYEHLSHIDRTVRAGRKKLTIIPSRCLSCGYVFENRKRFTRPGRCPKCRKTHIKSPEYRIC
ncbi:MAG: ArsR family transcriptional regulator [Deltaproteobacteria bacterium]|nr:ArsR family transcriptional regulator [Deltaproteobacteria bacterium]